MLGRTLRQSQRIAVELPMKIIMPDGGSFDIHTWDFSDSGVFLKTTDEVKQAATVNSIVFVQFQGTNFKPPVMTAKIVRCTEVGIALALIDTASEGH